VQQSVMAWSLLITFLVLQTMTAVASNLVRTICFILRLEMPVQALQPRKSIRSQERFCGCMMMEASRKATLLATRFTVTVTVTPRGWHGTNKVCSGRQNTDRAGWAVAMTNLT